MKVEKVEAEIHQVLKNTQENLGKFICSFDRHLSCKIEHTEKNVQFCLQFLDDILTNFKNFGCNIIKNRLVPADNLIN